MNYWRVFSSYEFEGLTFGAAYFWNFMVYICTRLGFLFQSPLISVG